MIDFSFFHRGEFSTALRRRREARFSDTGELFQRAESVRHTDEFGCLLAMESKTTCVQI